MRWREWLLRTRKVVDSNFLQSESLRAYLSASPGNYAVIPDFVAMEAYKGQTLSWIHDRMSVLADYPTQAIVLKGTQEISKLNGRAAASRKALIDQAQTRGFPDFCADLRAAKLGNQSFQRQLSAYGREATAYIEQRMLLDMPQLAAGIDLVAKEYSPAQLKALRRRERPTEAMREKTIRHVCMLAAEFFKGHLGSGEPPKLPEARDTFIFRYAICSYISILKRIEDGSAAKVKPEKLRNDVIDTNIVAFATYFDGLLTADQRAGEIYIGAKLLLREVFGTPPAWLGWLLRRLSLVREL